MKIILSRTQWILVLSPILVALLLTLGYAAIVKSRRADVQQTNNMASVSSMPQTINLATHHVDDENPALRQKRNEYLKRFFGTGPGQVSIADFAASLAAARTLPPSPLLAGESGILGVDTPQPWTYPLLPPLVNFWGGGASVRIDTIAVHPTDPDTVYVGSEGGLAKSTDGGDHWSYLSDDLSSQSIRSIAIDPEMPNIVYAGTGTEAQYGVGIYRSFDSGATWTVVGADEFTGKTICKILIVPATAGSESKTTVYASVTNTGTHTLWRSEDSGNSWSSVQSANGAGAGITHYDIAIDSSGRLYFTAPDGVFRIGPGGYLEMIHSIPAGHAHSSSFLAVDNQDVVYLAYKDVVPVNYTVKIAKSSDFGNNWTELSPSDADLYCFGVDPANPSRIFVGGYPNGNTGIYDMRYTLNGGATWLTAGGVHVDQHAIAFCPTNPSGGERYYLGNDGGIYRADYDFTVPPPSTVDFFPKNQNLPGILTGGVGISRDDRILIGTQDNANQISRPTSPPWEVVYPQDPQGHILLGGDGTRGFIEVTNGVERIYATTFFFGTIPEHVGAPARIINGAGISITPPGAIGESTQFYPALSVRFQSLQTDRILVGFQHVWRSVDSGDNWTRIGGTPCPGPSPGACGTYPQYPYSTVLSVYEAPSNSNFIYAIISNAAFTRILATYNANDGTAAIWHDITRTNLEGTRFNAVVVHPDDEETAYLATNSHVYKTTDHGGAWTIDTPGSIANSIFRDVIFHPADPEKVLVASYRGVFSRVDGTWWSMNTGLPSGMLFPSLSFNRYSHQLAAASWGRGVYVINLDRAPPTAIINSPTNGAHVRGIVTVLGTALDNHSVADFQFKLDGVNLIGGGGGDTPDPNVSVNWNTTASTNASHVLTLLVHDSYGTPTTSAPVTVIVDNLAPTVTITEPEDGNEVSGTVTVAATASDNAGVVGVQFSLDGEELDQEDTSAPFSIDWDTTWLRNGERTLRATARDAAGNTTTSSPVKVKVSN